jgi:hypothetical protein
MRLLILSLPLLLLLVSCSSISKVELDTSKHIKIDCGPEPQVQKLVLLPMEPEAYYDPETGTAYVRILLPHYENGAKNNKRIIRHFDNLSVVIRHYRSCIEDFNAERIPGT